MPTFLDLARKVGSESGTVSGNQITSVTATNERVRKVVRWVNDAYRQIQNMHRGWAWLQDVLLEGPIVAGKGQYQPAELGIARFAEWDCKHDGTENRFRLLDVDTGQAFSLRFMEWSRYLASIGAHADQRPNSFTISPRGAIILHPRPDRPFVLFAPYRMSPQELVNDTDVPEMPAHFHDLIVDGALVLLSTHDEAAATLTLFQMRQLRGFSQLEREQLPRIEMAGAFA